MDGDSFGHGKFDTYLTSKWRCQFGDQTYEFGVQKRDPHYRYKYGIITVPLVSKGMRVDEISKVVIVEKGKEGFQDQARVDC